MQLKPYTQVLTYLFQICKNKLTWLDISYMYNVITLWYILFSSVNAASIYVYVYTVEIIVYLYHLSYVLTAFLSITALQQPASSDFYNPHE